MGLKKISVDILRQLLAYDPEVGALTWMPRPVSMFKTARDCKAWNTRYANGPAMTADNGVGYRVGQICGELFCAHRVAWAMVFGEWPTDHIDHINGIRNDNRIKNLRVVSVSGNGKNTKIRSSNKSGFNGVFWDKRRGKWCANVKSCGVNHFLGYFDNIHAAAVARKSAEVAYGFHENHGRAS